MKLEEFLNKQAQDIEEANKLFESLPLQEQRRLILEDALGQIRFNHYQLRSNYFDHELYSTKEPELQQNPQQTLLKYPECKVCKKGSLFVSAIRLRNNIQIPKDGVDNYDIISSLGPFFDQLELKIVEAIFEYYTTDLTKFKISETSKTRIEKMTYQQRFYVGYLYLLEKEKNDLKPFKLKESYDFPEWIK